MKRYSMSFADAISHVPDHPERTARKNGTGLNFDVTFQIWPNRAAMLKTIELQQRGAPRLDHWRACVKAVIGPRIVDVERAVCDVGQTNRSSTL